MLEFLRNIFNSFREHYRLNMHLAKLSSDSSTDSPNSPKGAFWVALITLLPVCLLLVNVLLQTFFVFLLAYSLCLAILFISRYVIIRFVFVFSHNICLSITLLLCVCAIFGFVVYSIDNFAFIASVFI